MRGNILILMVLALLAACSEDPGEPEQPEQAQEAAAQSGEPAGNGGETDTEGDTGTAEAGQTGRADEATDDESAAEDQAVQEGEETAGGDQQARAPDAIYDRFCVACHDQGMAGAPRLGTAEPWEKRLDERGLDGLVQNSIEGYNAMPAQGTCMDCTEAEMQATVEWMLDESGVEY